jgi:hypothetical protein
MLDMEGGDLSGDWSIAPLPPERRRDERYVTTMRVSAMFVDQASQFCLVTNISCGGLRARIFSDVRIGASVTVELTSGQHVAGIVIWAQDGQAGLRFDRPIDVASISSLAATAAYGLRARPPRIEVRRLALVRKGGRVLRGETADISEGGVKLSLPGALEFGQAAVSIAGLGTMKGVVRWSRENMAGIEFNEVLPCQKLIAWCRTAVR